MTNTTGSTTTTATATPNTPPPADKPFAAKGNQQGQTTFAAKINRWEILVNNLTQEAGGSPKFKDLLDPFRVVLNTAKDIRDRQKVLLAESGGLLTQRNDIVLQGNDLYGRLKLQLKGDLGVQNDQLRAYGLKPSKKVGRRRKSTGTPPPPLPEIAATPATPAPVAATPHPEPHE